MNEMMARQFTLCKTDTVMILGIAGGNGLEHIKPHDFRKIYGVDINRDYLHECNGRYPELAGELECICADLTDGDTTLPHANLLIANLLIEYIGYECFQRTVSQVRPIVVSCIIQINTDDRFVSDSPYLHVFDGLDSVHHHMSEYGLEKAMESLNYRLTDKTERPLPNSKKLVEMDFIAR